jgi:hypothetical protein
MMKHKYIDSMEYEPDIFVYLKAGFRLDSDFSQDGNKCQHCFGEDSIADVKQTLKTVVTCNCDQCKNILLKH